MPLITAKGATVQATTVSGLYTLQGSAATLGQLAGALSANPAVRDISPVQMVQVQTAPNDTDYVNGSQWQLNGTWGINAPAAWTVTTGSNSVIVADTDSGLNYKLVDIYDNLWINQPEIPSSVLPNLTDVVGDGVITFSDLNAVVNGVKVNQGPGKIEDTDGDGIITGADVLAATSSGGWVNSNASNTQDGDTAHPNDLIGWNFVNATNNPADDEGHGTFTASEIAEMTGNTIGGAGLVWNAQLMPVVFLDAKGNGTDAAAAEAIDYAVLHGAKVINASWGGTGTDPTIAAAIQYADQNGVIIVAAAGNDGANDDTTFFAPASYSAQYPNVIAVAAIGSNGSLASWSDYGTGTVQLAAPGVNVYSLNSSGGYSTMSGTSMAAPLVTGTVALVEAAHPSWTMSKVIDAVLDTVTRDPALAGKVTTGGVVNAGAAVANTDGPYVVSATPSGADTTSGGISTVQLSFNEEINPATFTASAVTVTGPGGAIKGVSVTAVSGSNDHEFNVAFPSQTAAGSYTVKVSPGLQDWYGNDLNQNRNGVNGQAGDAFVDQVWLSGPGSSDLLSVAGIPVVSTAGKSASFTVTALSPNGATDTGYVGTVKFSSSDPQAVLPASYTFQSTDHGTHTFTVTLKTAGAQSVTATDTAKSAIVGSDENLIVQGTTAGTLKVTGFPTTDMAGTAQSFTVTAYDQYGNVATGYTGTVHFTSSDKQAVLPANTTIVAGEEGTATFTATLETAGTQSITATNTSNGGITGSETVTVLVSPTATFVKTDTTTQGTWMGTYGADGYNVAGTTTKNPSYPSYATVTASGYSTYTWSANTTDVRALQNPSGTGRIAAAWYASTRFTIDVNLTDGQAHQIALYALDWDQRRRTEKITISDATTGSVLDTETLSSFSGGVYQVWTVSGHVKITITNLAGPNAVLNGLFFQPNSPTPTPTPTATATFAKTDTTTQGTWMGTYGADGYNVAGTTTKNPSYPSYATVTASGYSTYTWSANTTDVRAPRTPAAPVGSPPPGMRPPVSRSTST